MRVALSLAVRGKTAPAQKQQAVALRGLVISPAENRAEIGSMQPPPVQAVPSHLDCQEKRAALAVNRNALNCSRSPLYIHLCPFLFVCKLTSLVVIVRDRSTNKAVTGTGQFGRRYRRNNDGQPRSHNFPKTR
jgi:hypothetical protein